MNKLTLLREHIKTVLRTEKRKQKAELQERAFYEYKLRKTIRKILKESDDIISHESTGINVLADLLETIVPILKSYYKKLGTDVEQRKSFRAHIVKGVQNLLSPVALMFKAGGYAGKASEISPQAVAQQAQAATPAPSQQPLPTGGEEELKEEDKLNVKVSGAEKDPAFIPLKADRKEKQEADKEQVKQSEPTPEDAFEPIEGEDETGRNIALQSFKRVEKQIREAYSLLANEDDRNLFYDYLITNLKLYFDKFEDELQAIVPEPTTQAYETEKARKQGTLGAPSAGQATPAANQMGVQPAPAPPVAVK